MSYIEKKREYLKKEGFIYHEDTHDWVKEVDKDHNICVDDRAKAVVLEIKNQRFVDALTLRQWNNEIWFYEDELDEIFRSTL